MKEKKWGVFHFEEWKGSFHWKSVGRGILIDCVAAFLITVSIASFAVNADFAPGGVNGLGVILNYLFGLPIGLLSIIFNIPIILVSFRLLGTMFFIRSVKSMVICALFMDLLGPCLPVYTGERMMAAIFSGIFSGIGYGLIFMAGSSTGGTDFLIMSVKKLSPHMSLGLISQLVDGSVIILSGFVFRQIDSVLYGMVNTIILCILIDKITIGLDSCKLTMIITERGREISDQIHRQVGRGTTLMKVTGGYSHREKEMIFCVSENKEVGQIKKAVKAMDEKAFVIVAESREIFGEGFRELED